MKKIVLVMCALGLAVVAAQAQANSADARFFAEVARPSKSDSAAAVKKDSGKVAYSVREAVAAQEEKARLQNQAQYMAKQAEDMLKVLIKYNKNFKPALEKVMKYHGELVNILARNQNNDSAFYQEVEIKLEDLAAAANTIKYEKLASLVKTTLNHEYYFPRLSTHNLVSLTTVADNVHEEASINGAGMLSAGLRPAALAFYDSLSEAK